MRLKQQSSMPKRILVVDDERDILDLLQYTLETEGYEIVTALDGDTTIELAESEPVDLIILDIMLPGKDGWEVLREIRRNPETHHIPVIFLTAKDSEVDEVVGLELGADDYIVKPISIRKLQARIKTVLRKAAKQPEEASGKVRYGHFEIDPSSYSVKVEGKSVNLTKKEFEILAYLAKRPGRVITRNILLDEIWGDDIVVIDRTIDVHIRKIREKLGEDYMNLIETIKGVGYRFKVNE